MDYEITVRLAAGSLAEATARIDAMITDVPELLHRYSWGEELREQWASARKSASAVRAGSANIVLAKAVKGDK